MQGQAELQLARQLYDDARSQTNQSPSLVLLLDLALASLEFERALGQDLAARDTFGDALDLLKSSQGIGPWLYGGAAHVGWTAIHLSRFYGAPVRGLSVLDDMVLAWVTDFPDDASIDLPNGLLGLGVYALAHPERALRERLTTEIVTLIGARVQGDDGIFLRVTASAGRLAQRPATVGQRDLGVAHGNAGLIAYLAAVAAREPSCRQRAEELLRSALRWFLRQRSALDGSMFPHAVETRYEPSRAAWCYGDPGIALALSAAADATGSEPVGEVARSCAEGVIARPAGRLRVTDACLCHGAAGLCWFGRRIRDRWGLASDDLVTRWSEYIAEQRDQGPLHYVRFGTVLRDASFLDGDLGVALALLYIATGSRGVWEERLLAVASTPGEAT